MAVKELVPPMPEFIPAPVLVPVNGASPVLAGGNPSEFAFLLATQPPPGSTLVSWRNEINYYMDALADRPAPPAGLAGVLIDMAGDPQRDVVVRDYALQHLEPIYGAAVPDRDRIQQALYRALGEKQTSLPGTALLALNRLSRRYPEVDSAKVGASALALARDEDCGVLGRITALQVCAALDVVEVVPAARAIFDSPGNPMLRRSARNVLGKFGQSHSELASAIGSFPTQENCHDCP